MKNHFFVAAVIAIGSIPAFGSSLGCRSYEEVVGWNGSVTRDYIYLRGNVNSESWLTYVEIGGAYRSSAKTIRVDQDSESPMSGDFNKFDAISNSWHTFVPLFPAGFSDKPGQFTGYLQVEGEGSPQKVFPLRCFLNG